MRSIENKKNTLSTNTSTPKTINSLRIPLPCNKTKVDHLF